MRNIANFAIDPMGDRTVVGGARNAEARKPNFALLTPSHVRVADRMTPHPERRPIRPQTAN